MNNEITTEDRLMSIPAAAACLDISVRQLWRIIASGEIPHPIKVGRLSKLFASDLDAYMEKLKEQRKRG
jgi:excisionase family DNA binding protein